jgi:hypothetical protein
MASIRHQFTADKPRSEVLSSVLADLAPAMQSQGYRIDSQSSDGVTFVRGRGCAFGIVGLLASPKTIAVNLGEEDGATRVTIVGQGPGRLKRAIESL